LIFLPFVTPFANLVQKLVPLKEVTAEEKVLAKFKPKYLDEGMLGTAPLALSMARREAVRMGEVVEQMVAGVPATVFQGDVAGITKIRDKDDQVDALYAAITRYLARISRTNLTKQSSNEAMSAMTTITELENIGDIVETHFFHITNMYTKDKTTFSEVTLASLGGYHSMVMEAYHSTLAAFEHDRKGAAEIAIKMEEEIVGGMEKAVEDLHAKLLAGEVSPDEQAAMTLEIDIMENLSRIYLHTKRIARLVTKEEGATALVVV